MTIQPGQPIASVPVKHVTEGGVEDSTSADILGTGTVVFFTVPGAFTPTCHLNHLPGYLAAADQLKAAGVDKIVCGTVNDHHVVKAWAEATGALGTIEFIADGLGKLAGALGLERDLTGGGLGVRFNRASLLIRNGNVEIVNVEGAPGEVTSSGAPAMLEALKG
ncbi:peroxiredoxin [Pelagibacterium halotolerans]|uniref:Glutathione-dependent peroxiredoxin n=1 Tax=Pelagibacterium halotolerans (strain DSM 22347 / JCM 15775 / CGMCC 1.7692 / B2) TaxID=1082931 RepID=G4RB40_PELHB|nr:peroxiredoxin [Pelagibacterium halotolerans]AEQ50549.1 putative alkyl hydroperoxide reductase, putative member of the AhpC/TSA-family protein [Pelagibacterium halotolerans B2]QJR19502.1 peroxiredoxin [Pelagibacterium halotolerans]SDZ89550.1 Peroxiredoxin [Pelagibacterium halotolerans]